MRLGSRHLRGLTPARGSRGRLSPCPTTAHSPVLPCAGQDRALGVLLPLPLFFRCLALLPLTLLALS